MKILVALPYISILAANILYLYTRGLSQQLHWIELFLYNFIIMVLAGIFITIHLNIMLHRWLVQEADKDSSGKLTKKQIIKGKVKELIYYKHFLSDLFNPGNEVFLAKIYFGLVLFKWVLSFLPGVLVGLLFGLYYQYKQRVQKWTNPIINKLNKLWIKFINFILRNLPRHKSIKSPISQFVDYAMQDLKQESAEQGEAEQQKKKTQQPKTEKQQPTAKTEQLKTETEDPKTQ